MFFLFHIFSMSLYLACCRGSKLTLLHRVKERKPPSLSAQASVAPFSLKVAWSGKSLNKGLNTGMYKSVSMNASELTVNFGGRWPIILVIYMYTYCNIHAFLCQHLIIRFSSIKKCTT